MAGDADANGLAPSFTEARSFLLGFPMVFSLFIE
jgi:hypothetical protein